MPAQQKSIRYQRDAGELVGVFERYNQQWKRDDGLAETAIAQISEETDDGGLIYHTIKGVTPINAFTPGMTYRFWGRWSSHPKYGDQWFFETFLEETPASKSAICLYLEQCDGIGMATAKAIFDAFGQDCIATLRERPDEVAAAVPRLKLEQCRNASALLKRKHGSERAKMDLMTLTHKLGVPAKVVDAALREWGNLAASVIKRNPYRLMQFTGIGFLKADKIWLEFGYSPTRMKRQALCCWNAVNSNRAGHTWIKDGIPRAALDRSISGADVDFERAMELCRRSGLLRFRQDIRGVWISERQKADQESKLARLIEAARLETQAAVESGTLKWPDVATLANVSEHQREELAKATRGVVGVLAGSPGTGKTYTVAELIKAILKLHPYSAIAAAAPTGKAAVRLTESLAKCGVNLTATTIHSLLGIEAGEYGLRFRHRAGNPLPAKFVFVDEASMPDIPLITSLLEARGRRTHLLFIGDPHQLPPIGHGAPLRDLLQCGESIPSGTLSEIQRNAGRGVEICKAIREKRPWSVSPKLELPEENTVLSEQATPAKQIEALEAVLTQFRDSSARKFDPIWDVQVVCALNKKGDLSRKALNTRLQGLLNADGHTIPDCPFRVGDKVVNTKNGQIKSADPIRDQADEDGMVYCANGEQGEVIEVESGRMIVRLESPRRTVIVYRKAKSKDQEAADAAMGDDKESDEEDAGGTSIPTGCSWDLAYAISAHKSQGSEWPVIIVMLDDSSSAKWTTSRQWLYTAISRFQQFCILIGTKQTAMTMCQRDSLFKRQTFLQERIAELRLQADSVKALELIAKETSAADLDGDDAGEFLAITEEVLSAESGEDAAALMESIL